MLRSTTALALALSLPAVLAAPAWGQAAPASPLDSFPAQIEYLSNHAPFVVFDVVPRTLNVVRTAKSFKDVTLNFVATDLLHRVDVFTFVTTADGGSKEVAMRIACGGKDAGHHSCAIPTRDAVLLLKGVEGVFGLRIEAEGIEGDRSTVRITLPVSASARRTLVPAVASPLGLTLLAAPLSR
jgi:hypothetical protein